MAKVKVFLKVGQASRSRSLGQNFWHQWKGLVTRNVHMKYESPTSSGSEAMTQVKVFKSRSNSKVKVTRSKILVPIKRSCHKEYTCEI